MRAQAMEKLLIMFEDAVKDVDEAIDEYDLATLRNLRSKSIALRDRSNKSNSVIKELIEK